jgi:hypothetical protein
LLFGDNRVVPSLGSKSYKEKSIVTSDERSRELEEKYEGYKVYDRDGEEIGTVDDVFVGEIGCEEYICVKMGFFELRSTLIPMEVVRANERERAMVVAESKEHVKDAPTYDDDDPITSEFEGGVRRHFGLESAKPSAERSSYDHRAEAAAGTASSEDNTLGSGHTDPAQPTGGTMGGAQVENAGCYAAGVSPDRLGSQEQEEVAGPQEADVGRGGWTDYSSESMESHGGGETVETFDRIPSEGSGIREEEGGRIRVRRRTRREESSKVTREESEHRSG